MPCGFHVYLGISFAVRTGEICTLIGPNGAGKSSLLNVINGAYQLQHGSLHFDDHVSYCSTNRWPA
ncbi:ATP-binding cassette domain-containing protein [Paraburkholderia sp.]|uniref:ATP-binding cassette domain-containing protein n=1 Tax=Paraburkholderia sp. TaxID=1926495 RepID=UPI0039C8F4FD